MARLQILELPEGSGDDRPPFLFIIDQYVPLDVGPTLLREPIPQRYQSMAEQIGARAVLVFEETIDIPANEVPVDETGHPIKFRIEPDFETFREQVQEEVLHAQDRVTRALRVTDQDRKDALTDALGMDPTRDWDDIRNSAAGLRKQRDAQSEAIERVRNLHRPVEHRGRTICWECSAYDFPGQSTDNAPVAHDQCGTLRALNGEPVVRQTPNGPTTGKVVGGSGLADA